MTGTSARRHIVFPLRRSNNARSETGFFFSYLGTSYTSPAAIEAFRGSTEVHTATGSKRQIDHMSNYSFDSGDAHFLFLDANPHLFAAQLDYSATETSAPQAFPAYPTVLRKWIIDDLDGSDQRWKVVVFPKPSFSSGNATLRNFQMRAVAKVLEDHGVNVVFNGHEHNYQRSLPIRATEHTTDAPNTDGAPLVDVDTAFDGHRRTVPDGVLYIVEGAGGNRDFDGGILSPRGQGDGLDQEDAATGTFSINGKKSGDAEFPCESWTRHTRSLSGKSPTALRRVIHLGAACAAPPQKNLSVVFWGPHRSPPHAGSGCAERFGVGKVFPDRLPVPQRDARCTCPARVGGICFTALS